MIDQQLVALPNVGGASDRSSTHSLDRRQPVVMPQSAAFIVRPHAHCQPLEHTASPAKAPLIVYPPRTFGFGSMSGLGKSPVVNGSRLADPWIRQ